MSIHRIYKTLSDDEVHAVDVAFNAATKSLKEHGFARSWDDRAERLVEAIAVYLKESQKP